MTNARQELLNILKMNNKDKNNIKCAYINCNKNIILKVDFTDEEYEYFLNELDFKYDAGYGKQELYGNISKIIHGQKDMDMMESEKWVFKSHPEISKRTQQTKIFFKFVND